MYLVLWLAFVVFWLAYLFIGIAYLVFGIVYLVLPKVPVFKCKKLGIWMPKQKQWRLLFNILPEW